MYTHRIIVTSLDESLVWVLSWLDFDSGEVLKLVPRIGGLEHRTHLQLSSSTAGLVVINKLRVNMLCSLGVSIGCSGEVVNLDTQVPCSEAC